MIRVRISGQEREWRSVDDIEESWVNGQIDRRRSDGQQVCVQVVIEAPGINVLLATPECASAGSAGRPPNDREHRVLDLWRKLKLNERGTASGMLIAFLKQLRPLL